MYVIDRAGKGFIVINTSKPFERGHTHLKSLKMAKTIVCNVKNNKMPKTRNHYLLISHIRLSSDDGYIGKINELLRVRQSKGKRSYYNCMRG